MGRAGGADGTGQVSDCNLLELVTSSYLELLIRMLLTDTLKSQYHLISSLPDIYLYLLPKFIFLRSVTKDYSVACAFI